MALTSSLSIISVLSILMAPPGLANDFYDRLSDNPPALVKILVEQVPVDYMTYYRYKGLPYLITGLGISAIAANTELDPSIQSGWQNHLREQSSDQFFNNVDQYSELSQYYIFVPLYVLCIWMGEEYPEPAGTSFLGSWGNHSLRALLIGGPQQAILTTLLGSSRPEQNSPQWNAFHYPRAVSGHAFYGSLPIFNLAKEVDNPYLKATFYGLSTLPAIARINNDKHYFSQAFLGWWLALSATQIVWEADKVSCKPYTLSWQLYPSDHSITLFANVKF